MKFDKSVSSPSEKEPMTLIVGDAAAWLSAGRSLPDDPSLRYVSFDDVSTGLLDSLDPDIVLTPLFGHGFDALDLAVMLEDYNYQGRFRALCPKLPNPKLVMSEVQSLCPSVDFDLFVIDESDKRRLN